LFYKLQVKSKKFSGRSAYICSSLIVCKLNSHLFEKEEKMRNKLFLSAFIVPVVLFLFNPGLAQQHPEDPGQADTLYFVAGPPCSSNGDTLFFPSGGGDVTIYINFWNDEALAGFVVPLTDTTYDPSSDAFLDPLKNNGTGNPLCFQGSRVENFDVKICYLDANAPRLFYAAIIWFDSISAGEGLFATMVYTVKDAGRICLDTLFIPPNNTLLFVKPTAVTFTPQFVSRCFYLAPYVYGDVDGDNSITMDDVVYLIKYLLANGPAPAYAADMNCDGEVDNSDFLYLINYLKKGGPPPRDPDNDGIPDC
jgi:hypothetical protein